MSDYKLLIGGKLITTAQTLDVINPATGEVFTRVPKASEADLNTAVAAAKAAQKEWAKVPFTERSALCHKIADTVKANAEELAKLLCLEQGKTLEFAGAEVMFTEMFCRFMADQDFPVEVLDENDTSRVEIHRVPLGVVAGIAPWNFPLLIAVYKIAPALVTGNSVIIKPSPTTPVATVRLGELIAESYQRPLEYSFHRRLVDRTDTLVQS